MAAQALTAEKIAEVRELLAQTPKLFHSQIARIAGISTGSVSNIASNRVANPAASPAPEMSEVTGDSWAISLPKTRIHTLDELVKYCEIDLSIWEVERFVCNKWESAAKVGEGKDSEVRVTPLFQIKAFLKKKAHVADAKAEIQDLIRLAKKSITHRVTVKAKIKPTGNMLEINIPDVHHGKLAWGVETGGPNYDAKISEDLHWQAFVTIVERSSHLKYERILVVIGNDLLNSDDVQGRTTRGTSVTTDGRYQKTFAMVRTLHIRMIEYLRKKFKGVHIRVVMVRGNHDALSVWHLGDSLECYFHSCSDVEIDNTPRERKYVQFGKVLLMLTHGDKGKRTDYPLLMATEQSEMFGQSKFREIHTGHLHTTKLDEQHGVRVRILPALCPADDWHAENAFVGNQRNAEAHVWNKDEGLVFTAFYSADAQ